MSRIGNRNRAKFTVMFTEHDSVNRLDVLDEFIDWTKVRRLKSYIKIAEMLDILPSDARKLMHRAVLPEDINDRVAKRMKEVMYDECR